MGLDSEALPVVLGAHGPRMTRLAAEETDGLIAHIFTPLEILRSRLDLVSRVRSGPFRVAAGRPVAVHEDLSEAMELARAELAAVLSIPRFQPRLVELRGPGDASAVLEPLRVADPSAALGRIDDDLVKEFVTVAEPDRVVEELGDLPGVDTVVPVPVGIFAPIVASRLGLDLGRFEESRKALISALLE